MHSVRAGIPRGAQVKQQILPVVPRALLLDCTRMNQMDGSLIHSATFAQSYPLALHVDGTGCVKAEYAMKMGYALRSLVRQQ